MIGDSMRKSIIGLGAVAGSIVAIWGAVALARPLLQSDPPPFVGALKLQQYAQTIDTLQKNNAELQQHQITTDANVDLMRLDFLEEQLERAKEDLKANPHSSSAKQEVCTLIDKIDRARARNGLPIIPVCQ